MDYDYDDFILALKDLHRVWAWGGDSDGREDYLKFVLREIIKSEIGKQSNVVSEKS